MPGDVVIDATTTYQTMDGFGASDAFVGSLTTEQLDMFFAQDSGIGLSLIRTGIDVDGNTSSGNWSNEQGAVARGAKVFATPWTPPAAYKDNGSLDNGGTLLSQYYGNWADILVNFVTAGAQNGVPIFAISVQNEPDISISYVSCTYTPDQMTSFVSILGPKLATLNPRPLLMMPEASNYGTSWSFISNLEANLAASSYVDIYATHQYGDPIAPQSNLNPIWETEYSTFDAFDASIVNGISVAQAIFSAIVTGNVSAWNYWELINSAPAPGGDNEGLVGYGLGSIPITMTKRLYTLGNFSKFVRPGFVRIGTGGSNVNGVSVVAFKNPSSGMPVVIAINPGASDASVGFTLQGTGPSAITPWVTSASADLAAQALIAVSSGRFTSILPAQSVTTFVGSP